MKSSDTQTLRGWKRHWPVISFATCFVIFIGVALGRDPLRAYLALGRLQKVLPAAKAAGFPMSASEIYPDLPAGAPNAYPLIQNALGRLEKSKLDFSPLSTYNMLTKKDKAERLIERISPQLDEAVKAANIGACRFAFDPYLVVVGKQPGNYKLRTLVIYLTVRAQIRAKSGEFDGCVTDLKAARGLCRYYNYPSTDMLGYRTESELSVQRAMEHCAESCQSNADQLTQLRAIAEDVPQFDFVQAIRGDAFKELCIARNADLLSDYGYYDYDSYGNPSKKLIAKIDRSDIPRGWLSRAAMTQELKSWTPVLEKLPSKIKDPAATRLLLRDFDAHHSDDTSSIQAGYRYSYAYGYGGVGFAQGYDQTFQPLANWRCMQVVLDAMIKKARTGAWPKSVKEASGKDVIDPYTDKTLHYVLKGDTLRVYSIDVDHTDNGGLRIGEKGHARYSAGVYDLAATFPPMQRTKP